MPVGGRTEPYRNFRFLVEIDGITQTAFREVIIPEAVVEVIEHREGHEPLHARKLPGRLSYGNVVLTWGTTASRELYDWWKAVADGRVQRKSMSIVLLDEDGTEVKRWNIRDAWPVRYAPSRLDAEGHDAHLETLELTHEGMTLA